MAVRSVRSRNDHLRLRAIRAFRSSNERALRIIGHVAEEHCRNLIQTPYPPPSMPGEPPHKRTGWLADNVDHDVDAAEGRMRLGVMAAAYSRFLEIGTERMAPRPFLRPTIEAVGGELLQKLRSAYRETCPRG